MTSYVSGSVATTTGSATTVSVPRPAGTVAGNLLVATIYSSTPGTTDTFSGPPGWTKESSSINNSSAGCAAVFTKIADGTESNFLAFNGLADICGAILQFAGASGLDGSVSYNPQPSTLSTTCTAPSVTPSQPGDYWVAAFGSFGGMTSFTTPTGMTAGPGQSDGGFNDGVFTFYQALTGTSATGTATSTESGASGYVGISFLLAPFPATPFVSGSAAASSGAATTITVNAPDSIVAGNLLVAFVFSANYSVAGVPHPTPSGWASLGFVNPVSAPGAETVFVKTATGSEPSTYTFTDIGMGFICAAVLQFTPCVVDGTPAFNPDSAGSAPATAPSQTPAFPGDVLVVAFGSWQGNPFTCPTGMRFAPNAYVGGNESIFPFYQTLTSTSATGTINSTDTGGSGDAYMGTSLLLTPVSGLIQAPDHLAALTESADAAGPSGSLTVLPRPALAGPGPSQAASALGAGGVGGGTEMVMRITAWDCEVADEGSSKLSFTLAIPPPGKAPTPPSLYFPQLIAQLQRDATNNATAVPTVPTVGGGGTGTIADITSSDGTVIVTNPAGPAVDLSVPDVDIGGGTLIGETRDSTTNADTAFGYNALGLVTPGAIESTTGTLNTAIGASALGQLASFGGTGGSNTAIGVAAGFNVVNASNTTFVGSNADAATGGASNSTCIGYFARSGSSGGVVIGWQNPGSGVGTDRTGGIAVGASATVGGATAGARGGYAAAGGIAIGAGSHAWFHNDIAIGYNAFCHDWDTHSVGGGWGENVVIGYQASAFDYSCVVIGNSARSGNGTSSYTAPFAVCVGKAALVLAQEGIAIGENSQASPSGSGLGGSDLAIGAGAIAQGPGATALANNANAQALDTLAVGQAALADAAYATALGSSVQVTAPQALAIGAYSSSSGDGAQASVQYGVSIGYSFSQVSIGANDVSVFPASHGACLHLPDGDGLAWGGPPPFGGGVLFAKAGALCWYGSAGTTTTIAPA